MKILIADDEPPARARLRRMLERLPGLEVVAEAGDGAEVLEKLAGVELLLLDVQMPALDGITLAQRHAVVLPPVIFVTAYSEFAVQAFEVNAVDYLLKPVNEGRLRAAVERARSRSAASKAATATALQRLAPAETSPRVLVTTGAVLRVFEARDVSRFWASEKYTVFRADGAEQMTEESLSALEARLASHGFLRVHRAELVNLAHLRALRSGDGFHEVVLKDEQVARVSRRFLGALKAALGARRA